MSVSRYRAGKDVFVSYDREDTVKEFVRKLKRDLEGAQLSVWLDEEDLATSRDGKAGASDQNRSARLQGAGCRCIKEVHILVVLQERALRCM